MAATDINIFIQTGYAQIQVILEDRTSPTAKLNNLLRIEIDLTTRLQAEPNLAHYAYFSDFRNYLNQCKSTLESQLPQQQRYQQPQHQHYQQQHQQHYPQQQAISPQYQQQHQQQSQQTIYDSIAQYYTKIRAILNDRNSDSLTKLLALKNMEGYIQEFIEKNKGHGYDSSLTPLNQYFNNRIRVYSTIERMLSDIKEIIADPNLNAREKLDKLRAIEIDIQRLDNENRDDTNEDLKKLHDHLKDKKINLYDLIVGNFAAIHTIVNNPHLSQAQKLASLNSLHEKINFLFNYNQTHGSDLAIHADLMKLYNTLTTHIATLNNPAPMTAQQFQMQAPRGFAPNPPAAIAPHHPGFFQQPAETRVDAAMRKISTQIQADQDESYRQKGIELIKRNETFIKLGAFSTLDINAQNELAILLGRAHNKDSEELAGEILSLTVRANQNITRLSKADQGFITQLESYYYTLSGRKGNYATFDVLERGIPKTEKMDAAEKVIVWLAKDKREPLNLTQTDIKALTQSGSGLANIASNIAALQREISETSGVDKQRTPSPIRH